MASPNFQDVHSANIHRTGATLILHDLDLFQASSYRQNPISIWIRQ